MPENQIKKNDAENAAENGARVVGRGRRYQTYKREGIFTVRSVVRQQLDSATVSDRIDGF